ncbi:hypothetical protein MKW94_012415 [Papaver nudicaule]|uniref:Transport inhibitor response 1 domain-containing protein n=1 Tax=Papaver nudicaule TaxID=74823 RepID=A0AA41RYH6_PAPNU|nr:hypothetical protein [Papaver nudicaule]
MIRRFQRVRSLVLKGKPRFADFDLLPSNWVLILLTQMSSAYPWLEKISVKRMSVSDDDLSLIANSFRFGTSGLASVASKCRQLRVLELIELWIMESTGYLAFWTLVALHALRKLGLNKYITIRQLQRLMILAPHLTHLGTGFFNNWDIDGIQERNVGQEELLSAFEYSKSLICLSGFWDIEPEYLPAIYPVCANLISLDFSHANIDTEQLRSVIRDEGLQAVAEMCNDLRELRIEPMHAEDDVESLVSEVGLLAISDGCRKLRSILYFCWQMTNAAVVAMSQNYPELEVFRLCIMEPYLPDHITGRSLDEGFGAIVMNCKKLTRLAVSGLMTDEAFRLIGMYGKLVRTLSVAFAGDSDMALTYVLEGCPKLQKLEIRDCPFGDAALFSGLHHYYNMRFLWMSACRLYLSGCREVAQRMPHLVVEVIKDIDEEGKDESSDSAVKKLYMYRSLNGRRMMHHILCHSWRPKILLWRKKILTHIQWRAMRGVS